ncbi:flagellar motor switch protein FliG [Actinomycetota bacterium]|nr:flagellar motor switch protein FliG [Actinomycetota bacterium]
MDVELGTRSMAPIRPEEITARYKAAVIVAQLGPEVAKPVFAEMQAEEIQELASEVARLKEVDPALALEIIREFVTFAASTRLAGSGGLDVARELLEQVFDESEAADMFEHLESSIAEAPFNFMRKMDPSQIISFIKDEHPQIIAIVLAYLPSDLASNVLASMQEEVQGTVAERIGMMGRVNPDAVRLVESILQRKMSNVLVTTESSYIGGIDPLISIIQRTDRQTEKILLEAIEERDPKLAETIRANLFLFEDVAKIDDRSLQVVLREVSPQDLAMSLKGVSEEVHEKVLGNLSRRAAQMLEEELELMGRVRRSSVEEAQGKIVAVIRRLEDKGDIEIDVGGVDDFVA